MKPFESSELLARIRRCLDRAANYSAGVARALDPSQLTTRERQILSLLADGLPADAIAAELVISPKTVATHVEHILRKLGVRSSAEAIIVAYREQIIRPDTVSVEPVPTAARMAMRR